MRTLAEGTRVIDTPGIRAFGLWYIDRKAIRLRFPGLADWASRCEFSNCAHVAEPDCAVRKAVQDGHLAKAPYAAYCRMRNELD